MSKEVFGVDVTESLNGEFVIDFLRAGGKYPDALFGIRSISMGCGKEGRVTQQSCLYSSSISAGGNGSSEEGLCSPAVLSEAGASLLVA